MSDELQAACERLRADRDCQRSGNWPDDSPYFDRTDGVTFENDLLIVGAG